MQMGQVTSAVGRSQSVGVRLKPAAVDEDEELADAVVAGGGLKDEATPLSSSSLSRSIGAAAVKPPRWACGGGRGESTVRSTIARFLCCDACIGLFSASIFSRAKISRNSGEQGKPLGGFKRKIRFAQNVTRLAFANKT